MTEFTTRAYRRSHGKDPKGTGSYAFAVSRTRTAFDHEVDTHYYFSQLGTYTQAKAEALKYFTTEAGRSPEFIAVLP